MIKWKASAGSPPWARGSLSGPMRSRYSTTELGQPWVRITGVASCSGERTWRKWIVWPSISVVNWANEFSVASHPRQS